MRLAKCCRPVPGDEIVGYVSLGRGITVHREDCRNVAALKKAPERFTEVSWDGDNEASYRVELQVDAWDRTRLLEDLSRTFAEAASTSSRRAARPSTRWSRTASWSRSGTPSSSSVHLAPAQPRLGLRRLSRYADRLSGLGQCPQRYLPYNSDVLRREGREAGGCCSPSPCDCRGSRVAACAFGIRSRSIGQPDNTYSQPTYTMDQGEVPSCRTPAQPARRRPPPERPGR